MYKRLVAFLIKFRVIGLIAMVILTGFFLTQIAKMEIFTRFIDLFPMTHPYVKVHKQYERFFGSAYLATKVEKMGHDLTLLSFPPDDESRDSVVP